MKKLLLISALSLFSIFANGQLKIEGQFGGANFVGFTLNAAYDFVISPNGKHIITPEIGIGLLFLRWEENSKEIFLYGLEYKYRNLGFGVEVSNFKTNLFRSGYYYMSDWVDMIIYPRVSYTFIFKSNIYIEISSGAYFAFEKYYDGMDFLGDVIPATGIALGKRF